MRRSLVRALLASTAVGLSGCSSLLHSVSDPGSKTPTGSVLKSIRCELITYLSNNYERALVFQYLKKEGRLQEALNYYSYIDIDRTRFAGVTANIKEIQSAELGAPIDLKYPSLAKPDSVYRGFKIGPALTVNRTFNKGLLFIIPQYASVGPAGRGLESTEQIYEAYIKQPPLDEDFYCYKQLDFTPPSAKYERLKDLERLSNHEYPSYEKFERIMVDGRTTLASWLIENSQEISKNILSSTPTSEGLITGQLNYSFELQYKPSLEFGYMLVAHSFNPLNPNATISNENTSTFTFYINLKQTVEANSASNGGAVIEKSLIKRVPQTP